MSNTNNKKSVVNGNNTVAKCLTNNSFKRNVDSLSIEGRLLALEKSVGLLMENFQALKSNIDELEEWLDDVSKKTDHLYENVTGIDL